MKLKIGLKERHISIIIILIAIGVSVLIFYLRGWRGWGPSVSPTPAGPTAEQIEPTAEQALTALLQLSPISFPKVTSQKEVALAQIPNPIKTLVADDARNLNSFQVAFEQNKAGFYLMYDLPRALRDAHDNAVRGGNWQVLKSAVGNKAGMVVLESQAFQVQILQVFLDAANTRVSIIAVGK